MFFVSKIVNKGSLVDLIKILNTKTQDGYIDQHKLIDVDLWLVRVACSLRSDAELVQAF